MNVVAAFEIIGVWLNDHSNISIIISDKHAKGDLFARFFINSRSLMHRTDSSMPLAEVKKKAEALGLEPRTSRFKVWRSTN